MHPEPVENTTTAAGGFLTITVDDSAMHHYRDIGEMLNDPDGTDVAVHCFDNDGFRLVFELNGKGQPVAARRTAEEPDQYALTQRIGSVIEKGRARLQAVENDDLPKALRALDSFAGRTYAELFEALRWPPYGHRLPEDPNDGDWFHNCFTHSVCWPR